MSIGLLLAIGLAVPLLLRQFVKTLRNQQLLVHLLLGVVGAVLSGLLARSMRSPDLAFYVTGVIIPIVGAVLAMVLSPSPLRPAVPAAAGAGLVGRLDGTAAPRPADPGPPVVGGKNDLFRY